MSCIVGSNQPPVSSVSGNIGTVRAKVVVYDHDPLLARPHQTYSFQMNNGSVVQMKDKPKSISFVDNAAFLEPIYIKQDMFIGTRNLVSDENGVIDSITPGLDLVQDGAVRSRLPGGVIYETIGYAVPSEDFAVDPYRSVIPNTGKHIFPHQLWLHVGSLLKRGVALHPSEYNKQGDSLAALASIPSRTGSTQINRDDYFGKWTPEEIEAAPKWSYKHDNDNGVEYFTPVMEVKQTIETVHWTIEKYTPLWQGEDFFVTIGKGTKDTDDTVDKRLTNEIVDTNWDCYKNLIYNPELVGPEFTHGISNEAFYEFPEQNLTDEQQTAESEASARRRKSLEISREKYWWKKNTYILIEVGCYDSKHNYFIELVKGRNPRFLVNGEEWDNFYRLTPNPEIKPEDFEYMYKCRVLSTYPDVSCTELFKQKEIIVSVRNQLGKIIVTFGGYEGSPWIITRKDNDPQKSDIKEKKIVPMVVPFGKMRIHGGNISCSINFSPIKYVPKALLRFDDRQMTTLKATDKDLYMTFSNIGSSFNYKNAEIKKLYFKDPRITSGDIGYTCDAFNTLEYLNNKPTKVPVYKLFNLRFESFGKGYIYDFQRNENGEIETDEDGNIKPPVLKSAVSKRPHVLSIVNLSSIGDRFEFGISETKEDKKYPYKKLVSRWDVGIEFKCGSVTYGSLPDDTFSLPPSKPYTFYHTVTPIADNWKIMILGGEKPMKGNIDPIDITDLVVSIRDGWTAEDFYSVSHEAQLSCYIPYGIPTGSENPSAGTSEQRNLYALGQQLSKLHDKTFYLSISYWWENGIGQRDAIGNKIKRTGPPEESDLLIQLTGLAYGASFERTTNRVLMNFTVKDYMSIFEEQFIFNSPFFDAVSDVVAVEELAKMAGFDDDRKPKSKIDRRPLGYLQKVIKDNGSTASGKFKHNGEDSVSRIFNLKGSFADLANPACKFNNGETYISALKTIAAQSGKTIYFDRWGVLKVEDNPAIQAAFQSAKEIDFKPVFQFVTSPLRFESSTQSQQADTPNALIFDPDQHASHLVFNVVNYSRDVKDAVNQLVIVSASNQEILDDGTETAGLIVRGYTFFEQITDPKAEGFFGFKKPFYQSDGIFGSEQGVSKALSHYAKFKFPPVNISFETFGIPGLKALDIISLDNNLYYINEITHDIDPANNNWWSNLSCSWFKPFRDPSGFLSAPAEQQNQQPAST